MEGRQGLVGQNSQSDRPGRLVAMLALVIVSAVGIACISFLAKLRFHGGGGGGGGGGGEQYPKVFFIIAAAILGSLVNQPFRDNQESGSNNPTTLILYLAWKAAVAIVFAIIINLIFISGVVSGSLFPGFEGTDDTYSSMIDWAVNVDPRLNSDMAKMLLWSFLAGFSEKLVPNMISKIFTDTK